MSKQPAASQAGGERPSRARATNTAPSTQEAAAAAQPRVGRAARPGGVPEMRITYRERTSEGRSPHGPDQPPGHGGAEDDTPAKPPRHKPSYVPVRTSQGRPEQPPYPYGSVREGPSGAPPRGSKPKEEVGTEAALATGGSPPQPHAHSPPGQPPRTRPGSKWDEEEQPPMIFQSKLRKKQPMAFCFTACCILFWLLVIAVGVAVLVVYLIYRPQPPRLRVTSATLNAGYIDEFGFGGSGMALNSDLTVLANISNPNTRIDIVLHYMQLDLYFRGSLIGTQAVWPAPLHEGPGRNVLRSVHLVVSEVTMSREDVMLWQNATAKGEPVTLQLYGRFHTQLNFGRWLPYKYWVYPRCTLWLDPPPSGALRRARC